MLIGLQNLTFEFGARKIVEDATWHIQPGERIGLVGYNGTGKSTLLKVLVGEYSPSAGTVEKSKETTIGYLHQDLLSFQTTDTITRVALSAFERVMELEKEIEELGIQLEKDPENEEMLIRYTDALHEMDVLDGYQIHHKAEEVLHGLGFSNEDLVRPYQEFSGGWRMRVLLAKMILQQPDVLLLDEPTNHLDLPSIEWLERYLLHYKGSVVIVSHDKFFLNRMVNKIVELYQQQLHIYTGNYNQYEEEKAIRIEMQQKAYENQQDFIRQQERFIERFKAKASKAAQAQSVQKRLDKLDLIEDVKLERPDIRINFQVEKMPGKVLVQLKNISKRFGSIEIVHNAAAEIERGDKIALIGANGKGKSTLLRVIAGIESFEGERIWGHNVEESFYAQHQLEALNLQHTILEELQMCGSKKNDLELRSLLGSFLFSGDAVDKRIKVLSGGEKARVALAKTIVSRANFMMLDEPTNHLDMHSVELLAEALNHYEGTYILVSHDRYFISKTANKIWEIQNNRIIEFKGGYHEWVEWNERMQKQQENAKSESKEKKAEKLPEKKAEQAVEVKSMANNQALKEKQKDLQREQKKMKQLEEALARHTARQKELEQAMSEPTSYANPVRFKELENEYNQNSQLCKDISRQLDEVLEKVILLEESLH
ncbi:MAG: ATP-binding cassette domain-containing protein [Chitinophagaceae bacterium]|jgi:ATP-binding cassette subfamily F protein 3|nr:ATP-binding cassette domain-containing protein [Chitinophagaceae bacterium]MCA6500962.1 ATP-binding cassette domain-containing protein [Chitinophagaceae bacterium]MCA6514616.1 ATP-binding cassette domain-containing protein [Chitinophagaceae bacterium]